MSNPNKEPNRLAEKQAAESSKKALLEDLGTESSNWDGLLDGDFHLYEPSDSTARDDLIERNRNSGEWYGR